MTAAPEGAAPRLSICVATFKRGAWIRQTLETICDDLPAGVEVIVLDGASPDQTQGEVAAVQASCPQLLYHRAPVNSGFDEDFDRVVRMARGDYCWLLADDDLLKPGAVARVLAALDGVCELVVVDAEVRSKELDRLLVPSMLKMPADRRFERDDAQRCFVATAGYLSFVGAVVVRRDRWLERSDGRHFGTMFAHLGVICDRPALSPVHVIAEPLISIRYGNAMWTGRAFDIWMFKWPDLVWSFDQFSEGARHCVTARRPWHSWKRLVLFRGTGSYSIEEYRTHLAPRAAGWLRWRCHAVARLPGGLANAIGAVYCALGLASSPNVLYDLARSPHSTALTRWLDARAAAGQRRPGGAVSAAAGDARAASASAATSSAGSIRRGPRR